VKVAVNQGDSGNREARSLRKACLKVLKAEGVRRDAVLSVSILGEKEMEDLNRRYLHVEGTTDVIAFPMGEEGGDGYLLGDVLICPHYVQGRREEYGVEEGREVEFVAAHGVLHLLGYDDEEEEGALRMDRRQREILGLSGD
jgi:probable rRNA maturation factor